MFGKLLLFCLAISPILSLPVTKTSTKKPEPDPTALEHDLEYNRYLKEIVSALESDPDFRKKLDEASEDDIRSGNIANELDYVNHQVRTKLDEIKREEIERLRSLAKHHYRIKNGIDDNHLKISQNQLAHLDHENAHTFEIEDLRRLILKTSEDLNAADKARREDFKEYELQKEFEKQQMLNNLEEAKRVEYEAELERQRQKHNKHEKVHHPGNKEQLEEVWEKQDHMEGIDFDPQTFFMMHDLDSNGVWDQNEVKALFVKELDKVYQQGLPEDDMRERAEEMERMREHVFSEADRNKDGLIDYQEFIEQTKRDEYRRDPGWETVDQEKVYTHEEYLEFERRRQEEMQRLRAEHPERYPNHQQVPQHHQNQQYNQHLDQQHLSQQQQYHHQQQQQQQYQNQQQQQYQNQQQQQQYQNQQQNPNQHQEQPLPPQQNINQGQPLQQNQQQQQFVQPPPPAVQQPQQQPPAVQQQQQQQPPAVQQQQPPAVQQQQPPAVQQQQQQKPISNSASSNQLNSNQVNSKIQNSAEQKHPIHGQEPQVLQPHH